MKLAFATKILSQQGIRDAVTKVSPVSGGCIHQAYQLETYQGAYFLKSNKKEKKRQFHSERLGLQILHDHSPCSIPEIIGQGALSDTSYLLLSWIESVSPSVAFWENFGKKLARQHRVAAPAFGLDHDNYIGSLPQSNTMCEAWADFFITQRLEPQLRKATDAGYIDSTLRRKFSILFSRLDELIPVEAPALLHGDLWRGNFMAGAGDEPWLIDPSVHYGHRETEMAFTTLFGSFDAAFYQSYQNEFPLETDYEARIPLHNLYPLLVHVNLFGDAYLSGIIETLHRFT